MKRRLGGQLHFGVQSRDLEEPQALWVALHPKDAGLRCPKYLIKKTPSSHNGLALTITVGGHNWRLHRSDPDIWPSVPHAIDNEYAEKLNPFTGEVYNVRNRQYLRRLHGRDLDIVQERVRIKWPDVRI